jgi:hypothetical protein
MGQTLTYPYNYYWYEPAMGSTAVDDVTLHIHHQYLTLNVGLSSGRVFLRS